MLKKYLLLLVLLLPTSLLPAREHGVFPKKTLQVNHSKGPKIRPALLPLPQQVTWKNGKFSLPACHFIFIQPGSLHNEALFLQNKMRQMGRQLKLALKKPSTGKMITMELAKIPSQSSPEAYILTVTDSDILIKANTPHGIFNGIQTLLQLVENKTTIDACEITDWPAFSWRGYLVDVGRNYMSPALLKQQIDIMAAYKLNVFHFHATEDIAWRIAIKQYPGLTAPENMLRNKGRSYSEKELKELIAYCKERHITFVPEIDLPGHSAAFERAMKTGMQTDKGIGILKNILKTFFETYDVEYLHIGADEVKISNKNFIPGITAYIKSFGKKVIGWQPGGNYGPDIIRQLWMDDNAHATGNENTKYIDSRHLYLNHMDPLESVVTIFNRQIASSVKGDSSLLGGEICMWHDRAVSDEKDILKMNPVYPAMLAFAERSWRGGGQPGWVANISNGDEKGFIEFENRLTDHQHKYFSHLPFPYVKQSSITWNLFGPYNNAGNTATKFAPEEKQFDPEKEKPAMQTIGGTIVLRHWWASLIKAAIDNAADSTTWYATTKLWSDNGGIKDFWIGFNNLSRSPATDSPPVGAWDHKQSAVWVNGHLIETPKWQRGGQKGDSEIPLIDEGYEYRAPTKIMLQKGWNTVLIKAPVASFKGTNWQNPAKWMFTFIPIEEKN